MNVPHLWLASELRAVFWRAKLLNLWSLMLTDGQLVSELYYNIPTEGRNGKKDKKISGYLGLGVAMGSDSNKYFLE